MSKKSNPFEDYVFSLSSEDFDYLLKAIDKRIDKQKYGYTTFEEAAIHYSRTPTCPKCLSSESFCQGGAWIFFILFTQTLSLLLPE